MDIKEKKFILSLSFRYSSIPSIYHLIDFSPENVILSDKTFNPTLFVQRMVRQAHHDHPEPVEGA